MANARFAFSNLWFGTTNKRKDWLAHRQKCRDVGVMGERHAELAGGATGLGRVVGIGDDERGGCLVECFCRVGLFHRVVADGVRVELALDDRRAGGRFRKEIGTAVAGAANADGGDSGGGEDASHEPLVVGASANCREVALLFKGATGGRGTLLGGEGGAETRCRFGAAARRFCRVKCRVRVELPRLLGGRVGIGAHGSQPCETAASRIAAICSSVR